MLLFVCEDGKYRVTSAISVSQGQIQNSFLMLFYVHDEQKIGAYWHYFPSVVGDGLLCCLINWALASPAFS